MTGSGSSDDSDVIHESNPLPPGPQTGDRAWTTTATTTTTKPTTTTTATLLRRRLRRRRRRRTVDDIYPALPKTRNIP